MSAGEEFVILFNKLKGVHEELKKILDIFRKNPNRKFSSEYLTNKEYIIRELRKKYGDISRIILVRFRINSSLSEIILKNRRELKILIDALEAIILEKKLKLEKER